MIKKELSKEESKRVERYNKWKASFPAKIVRDVEKMVEEANAKVAQLRKKHPGKYA